MWKKRITAVVMAVLMALSLLPVTVFASAPAALDGQLKITGTAAEGNTLSADLTAVTPENLDADSVSYVWSRKTEGEDKPQELGKDKTYTVSDEDVGSRIVLTITGLEDKGFSGSLKASTDIVVTAEEAEAAAQQAGSGSSGDGASGETSGGNSSESVPAEEIYTEGSGESGEYYGETDNSQGGQTEGTEESGESYDEADNSQDSLLEGTEESYDETEGSQDSLLEGTEGYYEEPEDSQGSQTEGTEDSGEYYGDAAGSEAMDGIPAATEDGTYTTGQSGSQDTDPAVSGTEEDQELLTNDAEEVLSVGGSGENVNIDEENSADTGSGEQELTYSAEIATENGTGAVDLGTVVYGREDESEGQYVTVKNTGTGNLNFEELSPEHFIVTDFKEPLAPGAEVSLWIGPRPGTEPGTYEDTITYTSAEGVEVSYTARMTVTETDPQDEGNDEKTGNVLTADKTALEFSSTDPQTVKVTNQSDQDITLKSSVVAGTVTVAPAEQMTLTAGASCEFTFTPAAENLEKGKTYDDTVTFTDVANEENKVAVAVKITLPEDTTDPATPTPEPEQTSDVTADITDVDFGTAVEGYAEAPASKSVTLTNNGDAEAELTCTVVDKDKAEYFDNVLADQKIPANGGTTSFILQPKAGLPAGSYEESFSIQDKTAGTEIVIHAGFTVEAAARSLEAAPAALEFASAKEGYGEIEAQQFTVTNNGNMTETLTQPSGTYFEISKVDAASLTLQPGASVSFTVRPKNGLGAESYQETVRIASANTEVNVSFSFQVVKGTATITKIQEPAAVTGLPNGTRKDAQSLKLPSTVVIETTAGNMKASVVWDVENCDYSVSSTEAQTFRVRGAVVLPDGVDNNNNLTLAASVQVSVNAYAAKTVSAKDNYITGIKYNGEYTTQSRISFTAVGAGMDNSSPRKGDTRYIPLHWTVINTNTWTGAPYTASFGLAKSGDYTLKVTFKLQQYNGSGWADMDSYDTKQVPFSISKAKVTAPGLDLTPAANRRKAVKTGDTTPILPFVNILIAAVTVIGGVLVYKRKRK